MKSKIEALIKGCITDYSLRENIVTKWGLPLIAYADANDGQFHTLKDTVKPSHVTPKDLLENAETVISYFIPFDDSIIDSNIGGQYSSKEWALAYVETNNLISRINEHVIAHLEAYGHPTTTVPATHNFDEETLMSNWSHRHVAHIAGLGKFGINNMLITEKGCCGRIGSIITSMKLQPTSRTLSEHCLYKIKGSCKRCLDSCVCNALTVDSFNRRKCFEVVMANDRLHSDLPLTDVCGKCCVELPCSITNPTSKK
jgi:epoxyqueuosine reductase QueG